MTATGPLVSTPRPIKSAAQRKLARASRRAVWPVRPRPSGCTTASPLQSISSEAAIRALSSASAVAARDMAGTPRQVADTSTPQA